MARTVQRDIGPVVLFRNLRGACSCAEMSVVGFGRIESMTFKEKCAGDYYRQTNYETFDADHRAWLLAQGVPSGVNLR